MFLFILDVGVWGDSLPFVCNWLYRLREDWFFYYYSIFEFPILKGPGQAGWTFTFLIAKK